MVLHRVDVGILDKGQNGLPECLFALPQLRLGAGPPMRILFPPLRDASGPKKMHCDEETSRLLDEIDHAEEARYSYTIDTTTVDNQ